MRNVGGQNEPTDLESSAPLPHPEFRHDERQIAMTRLPTPLASIDTRIPEAGRIRLGIKSGNAMKSIDTFRFTSPDAGLIDQLAAIYGGQPKPWRDAKASPPDQFEVITKAKEIDVYLPANALSVWYELWSGGGVQRRCDGVECAIPQTTPGGWEMIDTPCVCVARNTMECRPYTRLNVILPSIAFRGVWRLETKGWNAAKELPGMVNIIDAMTASGRLVHAQMYIERRVQQTPAGKRNFVVPGIKLTHTAENMIAGQAAVGAITVGGTAPTIDAPALPAPVVVEDDILDAEVIETELDRLSDRLWQLASERSVSPQQFVNGVLAQVGIDAHTKAPTEEQFFRIRTAIEKVESGALTPLGFNANGSVIWKRQ